MTPAVSSHPVAMTFDIEDWHHPELVHDRATPGDSRSVVREGTLAILERLRERRRRATFFMLGDVAVLHPDLVRQIVDEGHELACHSMTHRPLWRLTPESFRDELRQFRAVIREALGADPVVGFRAPTFSLDRGTAWALAVLRQEGFLYDSSVFPMRVRLYGVSGAPLGIYRPADDDLTRHDPNGTLAEFPPAVAALGPVRLPVAGGFYLRAFPLGPLMAALDRVARERPFALYLHPWECARSLPHLRLPIADAFITYFNMGTVLRKLERLLERYSCRTMREILESVGELTPAPNSGR